MLLARWGSCIPSPRTCRDGSGLFFPPWMSKPQFYIPCKQQGDKEWMNAGLGWVGLSLASSTLSVLPRLALRSPRPTRALAPSDPLLAPAMLVLLAQRLSGRRLLSATSKRLPRPLAQGTSQLAIGGDNAPPAPDRSKALLLCAEAPPAVAGTFLDRGRGDHEQSV